MTTAFRLLLLCTLLAPPAAAGAALCEGEVRPRPAVSFWCVEPGARVRVEGGEWGVNEAEGAAVSVLWAQGYWRTVEIEGETVAGEHRTYLPLVHGVVRN